MENVILFICLGSVVNYSGGIDEDVKLCLVKVYIVFGMLRKVWKFKYIIIKIKFRIFNSNVKLVLFYGLEIWSFIMVNRKKF